MTDLKALAKSIINDGKLCTGFLSADLPGTGGEIKQEPGDFQVTEIPAYQPSGSGTHTYFGLWKRGIDTNSAIRQVARIIGAKAADFGTAGLKDARAVTQQNASIEHLSPAQLNKLENIDTGSVRVCWVSRHTNKLKAGHLVGNRFNIRLRGLELPQDQAMERAKSIISVLSSRGVPNFYGPQRFGNRGDNWLLGLAMVKQDAKMFLDALLGNLLPSGENNEDDKQPDKISTIDKARLLYHQCDYEAARDAWPGEYRNEKAALSALIRSKGDSKKGAAAVDKFLKRFCVMALQSAAFNMIINERLGDIDSVQVGDLAVKTTGSGCFTIEPEHLEREQERASAFEISATAPLFGSRANAATGRPGEIEQNTLDIFGLAREDFSSGKNRVRGERRPMRFPLSAATAKTATDEKGEYLEVSFAAPPGCYATSVMREITK